MARVKIARACSTCPPVLLHTQMEAVTDKLDMRNLKGRVALVLVLTKLYFLLARMAAELPHEAERHPLFAPFQTRPGTSVTIMTETVSKTIAEFSAFQTEHCTTFDAIQKAYHVAAAAAVEARQARRKPWLVTAVRSPTVSPNSNVYEVETQPVGFSSVVATEDVSDCQPFGGYSSSGNSAMDCMFTSQCSLC